MDFRIDCSWPAAVYQGSVYRLGKLTLAFDFNAQQPRIRHSNVLAALVRAEIGRVVDFTVSGQGTTRSTI